MPPLPADTKPLHPLNKEVPVTATNRTIPSHRRPALPAPAAPRGLAAVVALLALPAGAALTTPAAP